MELLHIHHHKRCSKDLHQAVEENVNASREVKKAALKRALIADEFRERTEHIYGEGKSYDHTLDSVAELVKFMQEQKGEKARKE